MAVKGMRKVGVVGIVVFAAVVLLLCTAVYVCVVKYKEARYNEQARFFNMGMQEGYTRAVLKVISEADKCAPFNVFVDNRTIDLVKVGCSLNANK
jgi:hypothetical protein